jgi:hypothetical protein
MAANLAKMMQSQPPKEPKNALLKQCHRGVPSKFFKSLITNILKIKVSHQKT